MEWKMSQLCTALCCSGLQHPVLSNTGLNQRWKKVRKKDRSLHRLWAYKVLNYEHITTRLKQNKINLSFTQAIIVTKLSFLDTDMNSGKSAQKIQQIHEIVTKQSNHGSKTFFQIQKHSGSLGAGKHFIPDSPLICSELYLFVWLCNIQSMATTT